MFWAFYSFLIEASICGASAAPKAGGFYSSERLTRRATICLTVFFLILDCSTDFSRLYIATIRRKLHGLYEKNSGLALITAIRREMTLQLDVPSHQSATICLHVCQGMHTAMFCLAVKCFN